MEYLDNLFRHLGHRTHLTPLQDQMSASGRENGHIEDAIGRYVHLELDGHTYRTFYEESGAGVPLVLLHAADSDARMWCYRLGDPDLKRQFRVIAFDMPWHGRSMQGCCGRNISCRVISARDSFDPFATR
jgi:hypothetical protein